jgi:uncharacterized YigZ family protein
MTTSYLRPSGFQRSETQVSNSRFICTIDRVTSTAEVKAYLAKMREEMPDVSHHVYAFRVGYGNSVTEGMSDGGEPSGTAGPPVLAVLRGSQIGDILIVVTRYFGGAKLGTGGLVRAYGDAARQGLATLPTEYNILKKTLGLEIPYPLYELVKRLIAGHHGTIEDETFTADVTLILLLPVDDIPAFTAALTELSNGQIEPIVMDG